MITILSYLLNQSHHDKTDLTDPRSKYVDLDPPSEILSRTHHVFLSIFRVLSMCGGAWGSSMSHSGSFIWIFSEYFQHKWNWLVGEDILLHLRFGKVPEIIPEMILLLPKLFELCWCWWWHSKVLEYFLFSRLDKSDVDCYWFQIPNIRHEWYEIKLFWLWSEREREAWHEV